LDNNLYLIDVATKKETLLTPHEGSAQFGSVNFTADGIVFAHNDKREFYSLAQLRQKNASNDDWSDANREVKILDETNWDVSDIEMQTYGNTLAYTLNREGFSELFLRKYETGGKPLMTTFDGKSESVKLPALGLVGGLTFSGDGKKLAFSFSSAKHNGDVWVYDLEKKSLTQVTKSSRSGIPQDSFVEPRLIKYKTFDGREIPAWYYDPNRGVGRFTEKITFTMGSKTTIERTDVKTPVIISVHGGPEGQERPGFNPLYQYYLSRGYAVLAPNVRGSTGYGKTFTHLDDVRLREDSVKDLAFAPLCHLCFVR
jgi:dipeptidyl aminopeptidase/acylaminoacyl peptidase